MSPFRPSGRHPLQSFGNFTGIIGFGTNTPRSGISALARRFIVGATGSGCKHVLGRGRPKQDAKLWMPVEQTLSRRVCNYIFPLRSTHVDFGVIRDPKENSS